MSLVEPSDNFSLRKNLSVLDQLDLEETSCTNYVQLLYIYYFPLIEAVGLVGNFLSTMVFLNTHLKMRSSSYYLAALAITDFGFLCVLLIVYSSSDIFNQPGWCQIIIYFSSVFASLSVWLVVAFNIERFIAIHYPLQRPHICTVSRAKAIILTLIIISVLSQGPVLWASGIGKDYVCDINPDHIELGKLINFIDTVITHIIPVILIVIINALIAKNLFVLGKMLPKNLIEKTCPEINELQHSSSRVSLSRKKCKEKQFNTDGLPKRSRSWKENEHSSLSMKLSSKNLSSAKSQRNINKILLLISSVFIVLNFPSYLIRLWVYFAFTLQSKHLPEIIYCSQQFAMLLYYTNFSVNFLLYAMCGVTFRRCLWQLLRTIANKILQWFKD